MQNRLRLIYTFPDQKNYMSSRILCVLDMTFRSIVDGRSTISTITFDRQTKVCEFIEILLIKIHSFFFFLSFVFFFFLIIGCCYFFTIGNKQFASVSPIEGRKRFQVGHALIQVEINESKNYL